jgi:hypothetical protein
MQGSPAAEPWLPVLIAEPSSCLRLDPVSRPAVARIALDTVLSARRSEARLPLHILSHDLPEGVQRIDLEIRIDTALALFDSSSPWDQSALPSQWETRAMVVRREGSEQVLALRLEGPTEYQSFTAGAAVLQVRNDPAYLLPVRLQFARFNLHADGVVEDGLLVIRDSCHNNVVALAGLAVAKPWPQPAQNSVTLRLTASESQTVRIVVTDALGRELPGPPPQPIPEGVTDLRLDTSTLQSGQYRIHYHTHAGVLSQPLIIVR